MMVRHGRVDPDRDSTTLDAHEGPPFSITPGRLLLQELTARA
jgi:hypothetical protein